MRLLCCLLVLFQLGCASTVRLKSGEKVVGEIRSGYENSIYVSGAGHIAREDIKRVQHPKEMILFGVVTLGATLAAMFLMTPNNSFEGNGWQRWQKGTRMNYVFLGGMGLSSAMIYGGLEVYDASVAAYREHKPKEPKTERRWPDDDWEADLKDVEEEEYWERDPVILDRSKDEYRSREKEVDVLCDVSHFSSSSSPRSERSTGRTTRLNEVQERTPFNPTRKPATSEETTMSVCSSSSS